ncbi:MAG: hypothetical protein ACOX6S_02615 [Clostridia bacterium]
MEKKMLLISSFFWQEDKLAAIRIRANIKYLQELGWQIVVITKKWDNDCRDISVVGETKVYSIEDPFTELVFRRQGSRSRTSQGKLKPLLYYRIRNHAKKLARQTLRLVSIFRWTGKAVSIGREMVREEGIRYLFCSVPDIETLMAGARIKREHSHIKLIEEIRDPLSMNSLWVPEQSFFVNYLMARWEKEYIKDVDRFVYLTENIRSIYTSTYGHINPHVFTGVVITNGYDPHDYEHIRSNPIKDKCVFSHTGSLYGERNPFIFLEALKKHLAKNPSHFEKVLCYFVGNVEDELEKKLMLFAAHQQMDSVIHLQGIVPHQKAVEYGMNATVNLLITHRRGSEYAIPGKLFEYIGARRPILAISDDPLVVKLIMDHGLGWVCSHTNIDALEKTIAAILSAYEKGELHGIHKETEAFNRKKLMERLDQYVLK